MTQTQQHHIDIFVSLGDEFLMQYLIGACANRLMTSRTFLMGHTIELYTKACLVRPDGTFTQGHEIERLLSAAGHTNLFTNEEEVAYSQLCSETITNFDMGLHDKHRQSLELMQAVRLAKDLKYYLNRSNKPVFPVRSSLLPINDRFITLAHNLRKQAPTADTHTAPMLLRAGLFGNVIQT